MSTTHSPERDARLTYQVALPTSAPVLLNANAQVTLNRDALFDPERLRAGLATQNLLGAPA